MRSLQRKMQKYLDARVLTIRGLFRISDRDSIVHPEYFAALTHTYDDGLIRDAPMPLSMPVIRSDNNACRDYVTDVVLRPYRVRVGRW